MEIETDTTQSLGDMQVSVVSDMTVCNTTSNTQASGSEERDSRSYECDVCFMRFTQFANMRRHKLSHSGIRPFECRLCLRRFFRKDHLVEHTVRKHSKQRPLRCPFCAKTFPSVPMLKNHLSNAHSSGYSPRSNICNICGFVATSAGGAKIHYMTYHVRRALRSSSPTGNAPVGLASLLNAPYQSTGNDMCAIVPTSMPDIYRNESSEDGGTVEVHRIDGELQEISPRITSVTSQAEKTGGDDGVVVIKSEVTDDDHGETPDNTDDNNNNDNGSSQRRGEDGGESPRDRGSSAEDHGYITGDTGNWTLPSSSSSQDPCSMAAGSQWGSGGMHGHHDLGIVVSPPPPAGGFGSAASGDKTDEKQMRSTPETSTADGDSGVDVRYPSPLACHYCDVVFYDRTLYLLHKGAHSFRKPWRCNLCGHQCKHRYDFASHLLAHPHI
ncbi:hypothetical protein HPB47_024658 [Ixodes persulcatus]|uniref:Uncharacterized protein n=1 Tax=Ixodes persulcatus TaxID=34615 RepID=A0AC60Q5Y2_IXOPE|nr:hypothetical protein HPB47_024658 [Ixodes persulcatus]